jgi:hypothetical protein
MEVDLFGGYRRDYLRWNIKGKHVDILSELTWRDLHIGEVGTRLCAPLGPRWELEAAARGGPILRGEGIDSDYLEGGRNLEYSRSYADTRGYVFDLLAAFARRIVSDCSPAERWALRAGLGWHRQFVTDHNGVVVLEPMFNSDKGQWEITPTSRRFDGTGRVAAYTADWIALSLGLKIENALSQRLRWELSGDVHSGAYRGKGDWRLRQLVFYHHAPAGGVTGEISFYYSLTSGTTTLIQLQGNFWRALNGTERGNENGKLWKKALFREAIWNSVALTLGLRW